MADLIAYWDTCAVMAALLREAHSERAERLASRPGLHLLSTLTWAEAQATLARLRRERRAADVLVDAAEEALLAGPWRRVLAPPPWDAVRLAARRHALRGADLWHLASCIGLRDELPGLALVTFDRELADAARADGFDVP